MKIDFSLSFLLCLLPGFCTFCLFAIKIVFVPSYFVFICSLVVSHTCKHMLLNRSHVKIVKIRV